MLKKEKLGLLIKPTHGCNLNCSYCYDKVYQKDIKETMTLKMVEEIAEKAANTAQHIQWIWHGGEALLMGLDWFTAAQEIIRKHLKDVNFSVQTNGILLSEEMVSFLEKEEISMGISFDVVHQQAASEKYDNKEIFNNIVNICKSEKRAGIISVVDQEAAKEMINSYEYFKAFGFKNIAFNTIFKKNEEEEIFDDLQEYIDNWKAFITHWLWDKDGLEERTAMTYVKMLMGNRGITCVYSGCLDKWISVNPIGEIYHCDRFYPEDYKLGHLTDYPISFNPVFEHPNSLKMKEENKEARRLCLETCNIFEMCQGTCLANRVMSKGNMADHDESECIVRRELLWFTFEQIKNLKDEDIFNMNPAVKEHLLRNGYRSLDVIKEEMASWTGGPQ